MKKAILPILFSAVACAVFAQTQQPKLPKLTTTDGTTYADVTVSAIEATGIRISHDSGIATIPWAKIPSDLRTSLGYDPQKLAESARQAQAAAKAREPKARIGATPDDFRRAGCAYTGQEGSGNLGSTILGFQRGNYLITATFWGGRCHELSFMDSVMVEARGSADVIMEGKELTGGYAEFLKTVLDSNAGDAHWDEHKLLTNRARQWTRSDGQVTAYYIGGGRLTLTTKQFRDAVAASAQQKEKKSLNGL